MPHTSNGIENLASFDERRGVAALRRHQLKLLYGGGGLLTALIIFMAILGAFAQWREFIAEQQDVFQVGRAAISQVFNQGNRGAIAITDISDAIWLDQHDRLLADGKPMVPLFRSQHGMLNLSASGSRSLPWLVLQRKNVEMSDDTLAEYLGAANQHSLLAAWTILYSGSTHPFVYAYDPTASIFLISGVQSDAQLMQLMRANSRNDALKKLVAMDEDRRAHGAFAATYGGRISYALATNPLTEEPSLLTSVSLQADGKEYLRRVFFQPVSRLSASLAQATPDAFRIITREGDTVFEAGAVPSALDNNAIAAFFKRHPPGPANGGKTLWRGMGVPVVAGSIPETGWIVLHPYTSNDLWQELAPPLLGIGGAAFLSIASLWLLLWRIDRKAFTPALAEASRVYESEALNRTIIEASSTGLCLIDATSGTLIIGNKSLRNITGEHEFTSTHPLYATLLTHLRAFEHAEPTQTWSMPAMQSDGQLHQLEVTATPTRYREASVWLCAFRDITAQREFEESLARARSDAESASHAKSAFVASMSHEIRTPLHGILGHLELLAQSTLEPSQRERLTRMQQSADLLLTTISDVLDFSKIEAGQLDIVHAPFALRSLVESAALLFAPNAWRKGLPLYFHIDLSIDDTFVSDVHRISQIINNLLSNAVKFTQSGRIALNAIPRNDDEGHWICFEVIDSGIGLTQEQQTRLFEPFSQADSLVSRHYGGTGLGLALSQQLAQLLGGRVEVESTKGEGSRFTLFLPLVRSDALKNKSSGVTLEGTDIILVAAAAEWRSELSAFLAGKGAHVISAGRFSEVENSDALVNAMVVVVDEHSAAEELAHARQHAGQRVIRASMDGPLFPEHRNGEIIVSCYSSEALLSAIKPNTRLAAHPSTHASKHAGKVLLVEDHLVNRELIRQQLQTLGFAVDDAESGAAALKLWQHGSYDIMLTDLNMPQMSGYELTRAVRSEDTRMPILAITASALASEREKCRDAGITELLLKPISLGKLEEAICKYLPTHCAPREESVSLEFPATPSAVPEKIRSAFVERSSQDLAAMQVAIETNDMTALKDIVHGFKGALLMLRESGAAEQCSKLEASLHDGETNGIDNMLAVLIPTLRAIIARYEMH